MGTRCLTVVCDEYDNKIITMYRQWDGYPEGHGIELSNFLKDIKIVNGIPPEGIEKLANGMGCLAAQIVRYFKNNLEGIYLYPPGTNDIWEEYIYTVTYGEIPVIEIYNVCEETTIMKDSADKIYTNLTKEEK